VLDGPGPGPGGGGIRGRVTDAGSGAGIEGIRVRCVDEFYGFIAACSTHTAADGAYQLGGFLETGTYFVQFAAPNGGWVEEWFDDVRPPQSPSPIAVTEGAWTEGIDAELEPAGAISGTVTNQGGNDFPRLTVTAFRLEGGTWQPFEGTTVFYETDFELGGLPAGSYRIKFLGGSIFNQGTGIVEFYDDVGTVEEGTDVEVVVGQTTAGIDAVLEPRGSGAIAGLVTDGGGVGLEGIGVRVWNQEFEIEDEGVTAADGGYVVDGLFSGRYYVDFVDPAGSYPGEAYDDVPSIDLATPVLVGGDTVDGVDAVLDGSGPGPGGGGIRGTVTDAATGDPIGGIRVSCVDAQLGFIDGCSSTTAADGSYQLGGFLPAGTYLVKFRANDGFYATEWFDDARPGETPTPIPVEIGFWSDGIDAELEPAGGFAGTVTNEGGGAYSLTTITAYRLVDNAWVEFASTFTAYESEYELLGLPAGVYRVKFRGGSIFNPSFGIEEFYDDVLTIDEGTDVVISVGSIVPGVNAVLGNLDGGEGPVANASFDTELDPWALDASTGSSIHHGTIDVEGSALSGSAEIVGFDAVGRSTLSQCVAVAGGAGYRFGAWSRIIGAVGAPSATVRLEFFENAECAGPAIGAGSSSAADGPFDWRPVAGVVSAPETAMAARLDLILESDSSSAFTAHWDAVEVRVDRDVITADGFEAGSPSGWDHVTP
jgi:hypothetical protein